MKRERQVLLIDADDTLWENNIYFERRIERFFGLLAPTGLSRGVLRARLNRHEREVIAERGYGLTSFQEALRRAFLESAPELWTEEAAVAVAGLAATIAHEPIEFLPGAEATLRYLAPRHRLVMMTKGDFAEQTRKVKKSGIEPLFEQIHVVAEKHESAYREKLAALGAAARSTWMIGNSPRSDINPALAAGLNAVFIPHPHTWVLEHDTIVRQEGPEYMELERIEELRLHF